MRPIKRILNISRLELLLLCALAVLGYRHYELKAETEAYINSIEVDLKHLNDQYLIADSILQEVEKDRILLSIVTGRNIAEYEQMKQTSYGYLADK